MRGEATQPPLIDGFRDMCVALFGEKGKWAIDNVMEPWEGPFIVAPPHELMFERFMTPSGWKLELERRLAGLRSSSPPVAAAATAAQQPAPLGEAG